MSTSNIGICRSVTAMELISFLVTATSKSLSFGSLVAIGFDLIFLCAVRRCHKTFEQLAVLSRRRRQILLDYCDDILKETQVFFSFVLMRP